MSTILSVDTKRHNWFSARYLILPGIYVATIAVTAVISVATPVGAYYRIIGICPPAASVGMVFDNLGVLVGTFLLLGTPWWYLVGRIGWDGYEHRRSFVGSVGGAAIALLTCFISGVMTYGTFIHDGNGGTFRVGIIAQYWLVGLLCLGSLASMLCALQAAFSGTGSPETLAPCGGEITGFPIILVDPVPANKRRRLVRLPNYKS